jgi:hypothetical protein
MAHLVFLTSTPPGVADGSGTWVGISVLRDAEFLFHSESQGAAHVQWAVEVNGTTYVIPSDAPARALALLAPFLEPPKRSRH